MKGKRMFFERKTPQFKPFLSFFTYFPSKVRGKMAIFERKT